MNFIRGCTGQTHPIPSVVGSQSSCTLVITTFVLPHELQFSDFLAYASIPFIDQHGPLQFLPSNSKARTTQDTA